MRKELVKEGKCEVCGHKPVEHKEDEEFWVECKVKDCLFEEYDE